MAMTIHGSASHSWFSVAVAAKFYKGGQFIPGGGRAPKGGMYMYMISRRSTINSTMSGSPHAMQCDNMLNAATLQKQKQIQKLQVRHGVSQCVVSLHAPGPTYNIHTIV